MYAQRSICAESELFMLKIIFITVFVLKETSNDNFGSGSYLSVISDPDPDPRR